MQTRPGWRRLASRARGAVYRSATLVDRIARGKSDLLLPPAHLRLYYYGTLSRKAFTRFCDGARAELTSRGLRPEHRVLDIGSGVGILALSLISDRQGHYDGVDIHPEAVAWCQKAITPRYPSFRFHRADLASSLYNPGGLVPALAYRFPFPNQSFDFIFLGSVFTHMLPDAVEHYLHEIARLLAADGVCVASYFLLNDDTRASLESGHSFISFRVQHSSGLCRLHDATVPDAAVALEETFVRRIHEQVGLRIRDIRRGKWHSGEAHKQDVLTAVPETNRECQATRLIPAGA